MPMEASFLLDHHCLPFTWWIFSQISRNPLSIPRLFSSNYLRSSFNLSLSQQRTISVHLAYLNPRFNRHYSQSNGFLRSGVDCSHLVLSCFFLFNDPQNLLSCSNRFVNRFFTGKSLFVKTPDDTKNTEILSPQVAVEAIELNSNRRRRP